jgi:hypothetical protein
VSDVAEAALACSNQMAKEVGQLAHESAIGLINTDQGHTM